MPVIANKYYYLTLLMLVICSIVGLYFVFRLRRDVEESAPTTEKDLLGPLEQAYASGLMREEEFQRIQESMRRQKAGAGPQLPPAKARRISPRPAGPTAEASEPGPATGPEPIEE